MFTLPTKPWKHIVSKLLVSMLWILTSVLTAFISVLIIALKKGDLSEIMNDLALFHQQIIEQLGALAYLYTVELIIAILLGLASTILIIYAAIAIGHLFSQHKLLASFGAFLVLNTAAQIIVALASLIPGLSYFSDIHINPGNFMQMQQIIHLGIGFVIILAFILSAAYFVTTNYILSKRLNLE